MADLIQLSRTVRVDPELGLVKACEWQLGACQCFSVSVLTKPEDADDPMWLADEREQVTRWLT